MPQYIYQIKIQLMDIKPAIWRRVLIADNATLADLHFTIQQSMGWDNGHLHHFEINRAFYNSAPNIETDWSDDEDESKCKLNEVLKKEKDHILYLYDFGDAWEHKIILEKLLPFDEKRQLPACIKAVRACPPEDSGGVWGYMDMLEIYQDPNHNDYEEILEWLGDDFDPNYVNLENINDSLLKLRYINTYSNPLLTPFS